MCNCRQQTTKHAAGCGANTNRQQTDAKGFIKPGVVCPQTQSDYSRLSTGNAPELDDKQ
eukprot:m.385810 g.385810  ORF g.385810 m.385810 type:complete len:59 (+) comp140605_c0_seq1:115-291(+)